MNLRGLFFSFCTLFILSLVAQPDKHGCYISHGGNKKQPVLTSADRAMINASIARSDTFDIIHYEISLDVTNFNGKHLDANTVVTLVPKMNGLNHVRLDLFQLTVDSVFVDGNSATFTHDGQILLVDFPNTLNQGDSADVHVYYQGSPHRDPNWGGFYFEGGIAYNLGIGLTTVPPNFGKVWYPCFDSFVERATYRYHVISGQGRKAWCQGDFLGETTLQGDTVLRSFEFMHPVPTYASAIAAANYVIRDTVHQGAYGQVPIRLQGFANNINDMEARMVDIPGAIDACEYWYGPNPYDRVGFTLTTDGALEIPENIAFPSFMTSNTMQANRELLAHELGHFWWGDHLTPFNHNDMWMKEGPAEYSQHLTEQWISGQDRFVDMVKDNLLFILEAAHVNDNGYNPLSPTPDPEIYGTHTYFKGAAMMHNMRGYLGDTLFRDAMHGLQALLGEGHFTPEQFRDSITAITGYDMTPYFDDWIFQPGYSTFTVDDVNVWDSLGTFKVDLLFRQLLNNADHFHTQVPIDFTIVGLNEQRQDYSLVLSDEFTPESLECAFEPSYFILNGKQRLNLSELDYEFSIVPGVFLPSLLPYVDMRFFADVVIDTTSVRVEHMHAGPSTDLVDFGIDLVSPTHYWNVQGNWPSGSEFSARLQYDGGSAGDIDFDMFSGVPESDIRLVYRENAQQPWKIYPDYTVTIGNPADRVGSIVIDVLLRGQYAFAVGTGVVSVADLVDEDPYNLRLFPVPAQDKLTISGDLDGSGLVYFTYYDATGKVALIDHAHLTDGFTYESDVTTLEPGFYAVEVKAEGELLGSRQFIIER